MRSILNNNHKVYFPLLIICLTVGLLVPSSCKTPEGCETTEKMQETMYSGSDKKGKSNLFSKKQRKKMKKRSGQ